MNINQAVYDREAVRAEIDRLMATGLTEDEAVAKLTDEVIATMYAESRSGVVHGVVEKLGL